MSYTTDEERVLTAIQYSVIAGGAPVTISRGGHVESILEDAAEGWAAVSTPDGSAREFFGRRNGAEWRVRVILN